MRSARRYIMKLSPVFSALVLLSLCCTFLAQDEFDFSNDDSLSNVSIEMPPKHDLNASASEDHTPMNSTVSVLLRIRQVDEGSPYFREYVFPRNLCFERFVQKLKEETKCSEDIREIVRNNKIIVRNCGDVARLENGDFIEFWTVNSGRPTRLETVLTHAKSLPKLIMMFRTGRMGPGKGCGCGRGGPGGCKGRGGPGCGRGGPGCGRGGFGGCRGRGGPGCGRGGRGGPGCGRGGRGGPGCGRGGPGCGRGGPGCGRGGRGGPCGCGCGGRGNSTQGSEDLGPRGGCGCSGNCTSGCPCGCQAAPGGDEDTEDRGAGCTAAGCSVNSPREDRDRERGDRDRGRGNRDRGTDDRDRKRGDRDRGRGRKKGDHDRRRGDRDRKRGDRDRDRDRKRKKKHHRRRKQEEDDFLSQFF